MSNAWDCPRLGQLPVAPLDVRLDLADVPGQVPLCRPTDCRTVPTVSRG